MSNKTTRYVAEIDLAEGYISIDCDIEYNSETILKFYLNQTSVDKVSYLLEKGTEFKDQLLNRYDYQLTTNRKDIEEYLIEFMRIEFGAETEILIRDVDLD